MWIIKDNAMIVFIEGQQKISPQVEEEMIKTLEQVV